LQGKIPCGSERRSVQEIRDLEQITKRVRRANDELDAARLEQRDAMRRARAAGASYSAIGAAAGITRQRVRQLLGDGS
jgi:hypothetical protein